MLTCKNSIIYHVAACASIGCVHIVWSFGKSWVNVDQDQQIHAEAGLHVTYKELKTDMRS